MTHSTLHIGANARLRVRGLRDDTGNYRNDATVTLESFAHRFSGDSVTGLTYPTTLEYISGSDGDFQLAIPNDLGLTEREYYVAALKAVDSVGREKVWKEIVKAEYPVK